MFEGNFQVQAPGGLIFGGFFALRVWGGLYLEGLIHGAAYFRNFTVFDQLEYFCPFTDLPPQSYLRYAVMQVDFAVPPGNWGM